MRRKEKKEPAEGKKEGKHGGNKDEAPSSGAGAPNAADQNGPHGDSQVEPMELPPFEIVTGYVPFALFLWPELGQAALVFLATTAGGKCPGVRWLHFAEQERPAPAADSPQGGVGESRYGFTKRWGFNLRLTAMMPPVVAG